MARLSPWSLAHVGWAERWGCFLLCGAMGLDTLKTA